MDKNTKNEIDDLLAEREAKDNKIREITEEREAFLRKFLDIRESIAKPAMEEIREYLAEKGLGASIEEQEQDHSQQAKKSASISIKFTMKYYEAARQPLGYPYLSVIADTAQQKIRFSASTIGPEHGGHSGSAGECVINELTKELIHNKIMKVLKEII